MAKSKENTMKFDVKVELWDSSPNDDYTLATAYVSIPLISGKEERVSYNKKDVVEEIRAQGHDLVSIEGNVMLSNVSRRHNTASLLVKIRKTPVPVCEGPALNEEALAFQKLLKSESTVAAPVKSKPAKKVVRKRSPRKTKAKLD